MIEVIFQREDESVQLPEYATEGSAAMDIRAYLKPDGVYMLYGAFKRVTDDKEVIILLPPEGRALIPSGLKANIPKGYKLAMYPRSGLALKKGITLLNAPGTIDSDYKGDIGMIVYNASNTTFKIRNGDRLAQIELLPVIQFKCIEGDIGTSSRGEGGFGHTGIK